MTTRRLLLSLLSVLLSLTLTAAHAAQEVQVKEAGIAFALPDGWDTKPISGNAQPPRMDSSDPLVLRWRGAQVKNDAGVPVQPGMNLVAFTAPAGMDVMPYSATLMGRRGWPFKAFLNREKDGPQLPFATGYLTEFTTPNGATLKLLVVHALHKGKFIEINLSATQDVFPKVEADLRAVLLSVRAAD